MQNQKSITEFDFKKEISKDKPIFVRLTKKFREDLNAIAVDEDTNVSNVARVLMEAGLAVYVNQKSKKIGK